MPVTRSIVVPVTRPPELEHGLAHLQAHWSSFVGLHGPHPQFQALIPLSFGFLEQTQSAHEQHAQLLAAWRRLLVLLALDFWGAKLMERPQNNSR